MKLIEFYNKLQSIGLPFFKTQDVAILCKISNEHASQLLKRLAQSGHIYHLKKGLWILKDKIDRYALPYLLTMPTPSYLSLQTALYYHGLIMQIPDVIYAVSTARTQVYNTPIAKVSIHHITPSMFFGYDEVAPYTFIATPEKSLVDFFYFSQSRNRLFSKLPEVELPDTFNKNLAYEYAEKIPYKNRRNAVKKLLKDYL